jgi:excisionase family DNA binding protein
VSAVKLLAELAESLGAAPELAAELARRGVSAADLGEELRALRLEVTRLASGPRSSPDAEGYLSVKRAAEYIGLTPATIREWCESGQLPSSKVGKQWRIRREELDSVLTHPEAKRSVDLDAEANQILRLDRERTRRGG